MARPGRTTDGSQCSSVTDSSLTLTDFCSDGMENRFNAEHTVFAS